MNNPFEVLGLEPWADANDIRSAYRALVKQCHPDTVQDPEAKQTAQERMVRLNLAYEEALKLAAPRRMTAPREEVPCSQAVSLAERMLAQGNSACALWQLLRTDERSAAWYRVQGQILVDMDQLDSANQSFRQAIRLEPDNLELRRLALDTVLALRREKTLPGRVKKAWKRLHRKS